MTRIGLRISAAVLALAVGAAVSSTALRAQETPAAPTAEAKDQAAAAYQRANKLYTDGKLAEALKEVDAALQLNPGLRPAISLQALIAEKIAAVPATGPATTAPKAGEIKLLSEADISRIRIQEAGLGDKTIRGTIPRKALEEFWTDVIMKDPSIPATEKTDAARQEFMNPSNLARQVAKIRELNATKYLEQIKLVSDPAAIVTYRSLVQPYLLANCAGCHTAAKPNGYPIYGTPPNVANLDQTYTNFYLLTAHSYKGAKMLDRDDPEKSLLLQFGLPGALASVPHPPVNGKPLDIRGRFADQNDPRYVKIKEWTKHGLAFPQPDYGVKWQPPAPPAPPAPTSAPAPAIEPAPKPAN